MSVRDAIDILERATGILVEYGNSHVVSIKEVPETILRVLKKVGYRKRDISVTPAVAVNMSSAGGAGYRHFAAVVDVSTGKHEIVYGSWGGPSMFSKSANPVDNLRAPDYRIPRNGAVILGYEGGTGPVSAQLYVNPDMIAGFLPDTGSISELHAKILGVFQGYISSYRKDALRRLGAKNADIDSLIRGGYLKQNKRGAISITTKGKNAAVRVSI